MVSEAPEKFNPQLIARKAAVPEAGIATAAAPGKSAAEGHSGAADRGHDNESAGSATPEHSRIRLGAARTGFERFSVVLPLDRFDKLSEVTDNTDGEVHAVFDLGYNDQHQIIAEGMMDVRVNLQCQRCLNTYSEDLSGPFSLVLVVDENAAEALADNLDPVIMDEDGMITSVELLEDELVLRVPVVPRHADAEQCEFDVAIELLADDGTALQQGGVNTSGERGDHSRSAINPENDGGPKPGTQRPFEVLKNLKLN